MSARPTHGGSARSPSSSAWCSMRSPVRRASSRVALTARACGTGAARQLLRQCMQARSGSSPGHRPSMTAGEHERFEPRERCHRLFRQRPVPGRVPRRAPRSRPARQQGPHGIQVHGQDGVACDEHPVTGAEERDMSRRVTRGRDASPVRQPGRWPGRIQRAGHPGQARIGDHRVDPAPGQHAHQRHDQPAVQRVPVLRAVRPGRHRHLTGMHPHRQIPEPGQLAGRAGVVGVNVRQEHRRRTRPLAEHRLRSHLDQLAATCPGRVDQRP